MYCHKCGTSVHEDHNFCSHCGTKINKERTKRKIIWVVPGVAFFLAFIALISFYQYELNVNKKIEALIRNGEKMALEGDLINAKALFTEGLTRRPLHKVAAFNLEVIERGKRYEHSLLEARKLDQYHEKLRILTEIEGELQKEEGVFFQRFKEECWLQMSTIKLANVGKQSSEKQSIADMITLLEKGSDYTGREAKHMVKELIDNIVALTMKQGANYLARNQFTEAEMAFASALQFDPGNDTLLQYKKAVKQERTTFEEEEQKRLDKAIAKAEAEETFNQTNAIETVSFQFSFDEDSNELFIWGEVQNVGTRPISEIEVTYTINDEDGNGTNQSISVTPNFLLQNEKGFFQETLFPSTKVDFVEIVDYSWKVH